MPEFEPLYTADEMRAAEARFPNYPASAPELMERAGATAARVALQVFHGAERWTVVCGGGSNGGGGRGVAGRLRGGPEQGGNVAAEGGGNGRRGAPGVGAASFV